MPAAHDEIRGVAGDLLELAALREHDVGAEGPSRKPQVGGKRLDVRGVLLDGVVELLLRPALESRGPLLLFLRPEDPAGVLRFNGVVFSSRPASLKSASDSLFRSSMK